MAETTFPTVATARASVTENFPDATSEPDLTVLFCNDTEAFYDAATHTVILVDHDQHTDGTLAGIVETIPGHELPGHPAVFENLEGSVRTGWDAGNEDLLRGVDAMTRIFVAAQSARGFDGREVSGDVRFDVELPVELTIDRLKQQLFVWEAVRFRMKAFGVGTATEPKRDWLAVLAEDHRRPGPVR